jgi:hypothetical protein
MDQFRKYFRLNPKCIVVIAAFIFSTTLVSAADLFTASFEKGKWDSKDWLMVKSWRWDYAGEWVQKDDRIVNKVPSDATNEEMLNKRAGETYTSMLINKKFSGNLKISCQMSFDHRMAPGIMIAFDPIKDGKGRSEYREHFEIILYDKGINVWHHFFVDGKQQWRKKAFLDADYKPLTKYNLIVTLNYTAKGPVMKLEADGKVFGYIEDSLPKEFYLGIVASEGVNTFYDFKVTK